MSEVFKPDDDHTKVPYNQAGVWRQVAAFIYDLLPLFGLLYVLTIPFLLLSHGEAIESGSWWYTLYLSLAMYVFFSWFWRHGGQTAGMRAWKLKVIRCDGNPLTWRQCFWRLFGLGLHVVSLGLGWAWIWIDPKHLSWADRLSGTRIVRVPRR